MTGLVTLWLSTALILLGSVIVHSQESYVTANAPEGYSASAECPRGMVVSQLLFAYYGGAAIGSASGPCGIFSPDPRCSSSTAYNVLAAKCVGQSICKVKADVSVFGNPCPDRTGSKYLSYCIACVSSASVAPTPSPVLDSATMTNLAWQDYPSQICSGGDLNARCGDGGGLFDVSDLSLSACKSFCAADPACGGVSYFANNGKSYCTKKCTSTVGSMNFIPSQYQDTCSIAVSRLSSQQQSALPLGIVTQLPSPSPSNGILAPTASPSFAPSAIVRYTPDPKSVPALNNEFIYKVPNNTYSIGVSLWGAGGASMAGSSYGGAGAYVSGSVAVKPAEEIKIQVGVAGKSNNPSGHSAIYKKNAAGAWEAWAVAGAGGGASYAFNTTRHGGPAAYNGTALRGGDLQPSIFAGGELSLDPFSVGGGGGSPFYGGRAFVQNTSAPGAALAAGGQMRGGAFCPGCSPIFKVGASGGSGFYGGGSGGAGGGGGSSMTIRLVNPTGQTANKTHWLAGGRTDPGYVSGYADRDSHGLVALKVPPPCDSAGACYVGKTLVPGVSFDQASVECKKMGTGWDLASIYSLESWKIVRNYCGNQFPSGTPAYWIGLRDSSMSGTTDALSDKWKFINNASNAYFRQYARSLPMWWPSNPNAEFGEFCVDFTYDSTYSNMPWLNDARCELPINSFCCQYLPPWLNTALPPSVTPSASVSPTVSPTPATADSKGARYRAITPSDGTSGFTFDQAQSQCQAQGANWNLAAVYSEESWGIVKNWCGGQLPSQTEFWIGLRDPSRSQRGVTDALSDKWKWIGSNASTAFFKQNSLSLPMWYTSSTNVGGTEPNNAGTTEFCVEFRWMGFINDIECAVLNPAACCQYLPPGFDSGVSPTPSPSPSISASTSSSPSRSQTMSSSPSPSSLSPGSTRGYLFRNAWSPQVTGDGNYINVPQYAGIKTISASHTFAIWVKTTNNWAGGIKEMYFLSNAGKSGSYNPAWSVGMRGSGKQPSGIRYQVIDAPAWVANDYEFSVGFPTSTWFHLAVTVEPDKANLWINGQVVQTIAKKAITGKVYTSSDPLRLGYDDNYWSIVGPSRSWTDTFRGSLRDFVLFSRVLSQDEIGLLLVGAMDKFSTAPANSSLSLWMPLGGANDRDNLTNYGVGGLKGYYNTKNVNLGGSVESFPAFPAIAGVKSNFSSLPTIRWVCPNGEQQATVNWTSTGYVAPRGTDLVCYPASVSATATPSPSLSVSASNSVLPSRSTSPSISASASITGSRSITSSVSPSTSSSTSVSPTGSQSVAASPSTSGSASASATKSVAATRSVSPSVTTTTSGSGSASRSVAPTMSTSSSASVSMSGSVSPTRSLSPSSSVSSSSSVSATRSVAATPTVSGSTSPSTSVSVTPSRSISPSTTASVSASTTASNSVAATVTVSVSVTRSGSGSVSSSASVSRSTTPSVSGSSSPSSSVSPSLSASTTVSTSVSGSTSSSVSATSSRSASTSRSVSTSATASVTSSTTVSRSVTVSSSVSSSATFTSSVSSSGTVSSTISSSESVTASETPTQTTQPSSSVTGSVTVSSTETSSETASGSVSPSGSATSTISPSQSITSSETETSSISASSSVSATESSSSTVSPSETISPTVSPSESVSGSETTSSTETSSSTVSPSESITSTVSPSESETSSVSATESNSPSKSVTSTVSPSESLTSTASPTESASSSVSASWTISSSETASTTVSPSESVTGSVSPSNTITSTETETSSVSASSSVSSSESPSATTSPSESVSSSITASTSVSATVSSSETATSSVSLTATLTESSSVSHSYSVSVSASETSSTTASGSTSASFTPSVSGSLTISGTISASASSSCSSSLTKSASRTASVSSSPSVSPSSSISESVSPSTSESESVTASQSVEPSVSVSSSASQSVEPTTSITLSASKSISPSMSPSSTASPSITPSMTVSPSGTPAPKEERCRLGTSVIQVDVPGTLLITTPAEALNGTSVSTLSCSWVITAPVGHVISISFLAYAAQPSIDYLSAFDGASASSPTLLYMATSGLTGWAPRPITSTGRYLYLWFLSTAYFNSKGLIAVPAFIPIESTMSVGDNTLVALSLSPSKIIGALSRPRPASVLSGAAVDPDVSGSSSSTRGNIYRCGPGLTSGNINRTATIITTNPGLPVGTPLGATVDCSLTITAPPGFVVALSFLNYTLAPARDYYSLHDGAHAAATPLVYMATGAFQPSDATLSSPSSDLEKEATHLPPVAVSSGQYLYFRYQSIDFDLIDPVSGRPRGITAVITFLQAPPARAVAASSSDSDDDESGPNPLACLSVSLRSRPWNNAPNYPNYQISRNGGYGSLPPANISVVTLRGKAITLGYQQENGRASLKDRGAFTLSLVNCNRNCSKTDSPAVDQAPLYVADFYRKRDNCGFSGLCVFLWAFTDPNGKLLDAPELAMTSKITVPQTASYLSFGYSDLDSRDNSGSVPICIYSYIAPSPSPMASASATLIPSASASPIPPDVTTMVRITITLKGPDGLACVSSKACLLSSILAVNETINTMEALRRDFNIASANSNVVSTIYIVAAGTGEPPAPGSNATTKTTGGSGTPQGRMLITTTKTSTSSEALTFSHGSPLARHLIDIQGDTQLIASDDVTASLLAAVAKEPLAPLWLTVAIGLRDVTVTSRGRRLQTSSSSTANSAAQQLAASAISAVQGSLASGDYQTTFGSKLEAALMADPNGEGAKASLQGFLTVLKTPGGATGGVAFSAVTAVIAGGSTGGTTTGGGSGGSGNNDGGASSAGLSGGAIAGIVLGALALAGIGTAAAFFIHQKRAANNEDYSGMLWVSRRNVLATASKKEVQHEQQQSEGASASVRKGSGIRLESRRIGGGGSTTKGNSGTTSPATISVRIVGLSTRGAGGSVAGLTTISRRAGDGLTTLSPIRLQSVRPSPLSGPSGRPSSMGAPPIQAVLRAPSRKASLRLPSGAAATNPVLGSSSTHNLAAVSQRSIVISPSSVASPAAAPRTNNPVSRLASVKMTAANHNQPRSSPTSGGGLANPFHKAAAAIPRMPVSHTAFQPSAYALYQPSPEVLRKSAEAAAAAAVRRQASLRNPVVTAAASSASPSASPRESIYGAPPIAFVTEATQ